MCAWQQWSAYASQPMIVTIALMQDEQLHKNRRVTGMPLVESAPRCSVDSKSWQTLWPNLRGSPESQTARRLAGARSRSLPACGRPCSTAGSTGRCHQGRCHQRLHSSGQEWSMIHNECRFWLSCLIPMHFLHRGQQRVFSMRPKR